MCWNVRCFSMRRVFPLLLLLAFARAGIFAGPPAGYYDPANGLTGLPLKQALHDIIKGQTVLPYEFGLFTPIRNIWQDPGNSTQMQLIYSGTTVSKSSGTWNREHLWPRSRGNDEHLGPDDSDLFHVSPADPAVNTQRSVLYFDNSSAADSPLVNPAHPNAPLCTRDSNSWEPPAVQKGDIARALFYMATRYDGTEPNTTDLELVGTGPTGPQMGNLDTLIAWHNADPPDATEMGRNDLIYTAYQHNRNPFIDHPEWVAAIWGTGTGGLPIAQSTPGVSPAIEQPSVRGSFIVRLSPPASVAPITVNFTISGTASSSDFVLSGPGVTRNGAANSGSIVFPIGGTGTVTVNLAPVADGVLEPLESALLAVVPGAGYNVTGAPAAVAISDTIPTAPTGVIALWNFNSANNLTGLPAFAATQPANFGAGEVRLAGWRDATGGTGTVGANDDFTGVTGTSLGLIGTGGNGKHLDVVFSSAGWAALSASLFTRGTSTGYTTGTWSWSIDGTNFTTIAGLNTASTASGFQLEPLVVDLSNIPELNNATTVTLRYTLTGATGTTGNNRIDDLKILGTRYSAVWLARFDPLLGANAAYTADIDHDGLSNFAEWAFDLDPFTPNGSTGLTTGTIVLPDPADGNVPKLWPTFTFTRRTDAQPPTYMIESSGNFTQWSSGLTPLETAAGPSVGSERATFRGPMPLTGTGAVSPIFGRVRAANP